MSLPNNAHGEYGDGDSVVTYSQLERLKEEIKRLKRRCRKRALTSLERKTIDVSMAFNGGVPLEQWELEIRDRIRRKLRDYE